MPAPHGENPPPSLSVPHGMERAIVLGLLLAACTAAPPPPTRAPHRAVVIGDSVAHGLAEHISFVAAQNLGINGARTWTVLRLLRDAHARAAVASADIVIVSIGGNDLYGDAAARLLTTLWPSHAMERTLDRVVRIVATIRSANPSARIELLGLYDPYRTPSLDRKVNEWDARLIERFAGAREVDVIRIADLFRLPRLSPSDHFHPSAEGYELIAKRLAQSF